MSDAEAVSGREESMSIMSSARSQSTFSVVTCFGLISLKGMAGMGGMSCPLSKVNVELPANACVAWALISPWPKANPELLRLYALSALSLAAALELGLETASLFGL